MVEFIEVGKILGNKRVIDGISFKAYPGEALGILGPNGAGKTTLMRLIAGHYKATSGKVNICEREFNGRQVSIKKNIGYVPEMAPLYNEMSVTEYLTYIGKIRLIKKKFLELSFQKVVEICGLEAVLNKQIENLSKGYKRRLSMAQAMIHNPSILLLDEPTDGLDPKQKYYFRKLIRKISSTKCIIITGHNLEEIEILCDRVIILENGKMSFEGNIEDLKSVSPSGNLYWYFNKMPHNEVDVR